MILEIRYKGSLRRYKGLTSARAHEYAARYYASFGKLLGKAMKVRVTEEERPP